MDQRKIDRINDLARRVKAGEALTPEELAERDALDNTYRVEPDGTKHRLPKRR